MISNAVAWKPQSLHMAEFGIYAPRIHLQNLSMEKTCIPTFGLVPGIPGKGAAGQENTSSTKCSNICLGCSRKATGKRAVHCPPQEERTRGSPGFSLQILQISWGFAERFISRTNSCELLSSASRSLRTSSGCQVGDGFCGAAFAVFEHILR